MKRLAIINPVCLNRRGNNAKILGNIRKNTGAKIIISQHPGDAGQIARASAEYDNIISVGGDGTLSQIINGMDLKKQSLSFVPLGTGNSLARDLALKKPGQENTTIDLMGCEITCGASTITKYSATTSSFGYISEVVSLGNRRLKSLNQLCYPLATLLCLHKQKTIKAVLEIDNAAPQIIFFTIFFVNNSGHAGNFLVFPQADITDGLLDFWYLRGNPLSQLLLNISVLSKRYFYSPGVIGKTKTITLTFDRAQKLMLDGETIEKATKITWTVIPQGLKLCDDIKI